MVLDRRRGNKFMFVNVRLFPVNLKGTNEKEVQTAIRNVSLYNVGEN